ncbi:putative intron-encoded endonuclease aI4 [Erysiphe neolycopersici]|uniref:Putative intron-encoded endonuclease aI4 n=1 Tax=Erysiphe neolycopersici TaxID=212602 RepID=A0A420I835_9PEZI|nr:putative intron-encoded endonuclease aI4 [Erysiphe neolycopersici]
MGGKTLSENNCFIPSVTITRYAMTFYHTNNSIKIPESGLLEGDGTIHVPKTLRSVKGTLNYPSFFKFLKDLPLALIIQRELGHGSLSKKKGANAYILTKHNEKKGFNTDSLLSNA